MNATLKDHLKEVMKAREDLGLSFEHSSVVDEAQNFVDINKKLKDLDISNLEVAFGTTFATWDTSSAEPTV